MKDVHKKSLDAAVNQVLLTAHRSRMPLVWDRAEAMQPQCGFGRLSICCTDCQEGPCRTNPFGAETQQTVCGRDQYDLAAGSFLRKAADGALALTKLAAQAGQSFSEQAVRDLAISNDEMLAFESAGLRLAAIGRHTNAALGAICQSRRTAGDTGLPDVVGVNIGVLHSDSVNIVLHGHVDGTFAAGLRAAALDGGVPVSFSGMCGNELNGGLRLPLLTNYDSQEAPLLTGLVDLLVIGEQCVMPAVIKLAGSRGIPVVRAADASLTADYAGAVRTARQSFQRRSGLETAAPAVRSAACIGFTIDNSTDLFRSVTEQFRLGNLRGVVYLGGCGTVANTQDARPVSLAAALVDAGYLVITAGCAGTALAKAGMCRPGWDNGSYALRRVLPPDTPPVLHIGSCHDAGELLRIAAVLRQENLPVYGVFPEINHNKVLATAAGFAAAGLPAWLGFDVIPDNLGRDNGLLPLPDTVTLLQALDRGTGQ
ncbi:carbon-monoxide dehydrogenase catalytic subunit [Acetonema longum]|uniref:Carbon-monoxide dehydrogenase, catalytic subunit n=1 Tax=Acetonema longum DSM 6540 TaxID=1009370 RepID=F7NE20_9FIRM|nr:carbon-monoxide dehydrogenase catalytic subunit [Acetonema longum]EGO65675.1 carbon-monoxide dehydrogenase, catalytic subunit [Acetonema longum DSM 6540]